MARARHERAQAAPQPQLPRSVPSHGKARPEESGSADPGSARRDWTVTEFASALGFKVRARELTPDAARAAQSLLARRAGESLRVFGPEAADFGLANEYPGDYALGLRTGDTLHLAIARSREGSTVLSLDRTFIAAGRRLAIPTLRLA